MKISKLLLSLMISGSSLGTAAAQEAPNGMSLSSRAANGPTVQNSSKHIGDNAVVPAAPEFTPAKRASAGISDRTKAHVGDMEAIAPTAMNYAPASFQAASPVAHSEPTYMSQGSCDNACAGSCLADCGCGPSTWFSSETLLWFGQARNAPPLLTTSAAGVLPVVGQPGVATVVGGSDGISSGLMPGYRVAGGFYFGPQQKIGLSGRVFGLLRSSDTFSQASDGTTSIGLPFFNTLLPGNDAYLVAFNNGQPVASGSASVKNTLDLIAAEPSLRLMVGRSNDHKVELLGGYTYLRMKDSLDISSTATDLFTGNLTPDGTVFRTQDRFATSNTFNGAHLGLETSVKRRRVSLTTLGKVSFGNFAQRSTVSGQTTIAPPPGTTPGAPTAGGIYAQTSNIGSLAQDKFGFIPELGLKGGLNLRSNLQLTAGYTFLYLSNVATAGNQIDPNIDLTQAAGQPGVQPVAGLRDGSMWFQGVDLGLNWTF